MGDASDDSGDRTQRWLSACADDEACARAVAELETFLDGECGQDIAAAVRAHLEECPGCLERHDFEHALRAVIATRCKDAAPGELVDRVRRSLGLST